jgi:murein DD-endopeptidase MepM/ murein hydrolase activator NlpD
LNASLAHRLRQTRDFAAQHRRGIVASAVVLLAGFGVTAFGIAPLAPDAARLPQRLVTEAVTPDHLGSQVDALAEHELVLLRNDITRSTDTPARLLARLGITDAAAVAFMRSDATARKLLGGRGGKMVQVQATQNNTLVKLVARYPAERAELAKTHFTRLTLSRNAGRWATQVETVPLATQVRLGSGTIRTSLFAATDDALLPDSVATQMAELFSTDIDFHRELRKGDTFSVVYEALTADGEVVAWNEGAGRVLAAEVINNGRAYKSLWFGTDGGKGGYFGPDGQSKRRVFLASPMEFSRITSGFAMRFHPILQTWRAHLGVDYAAPIGTAVRSVGEGLVDFAGWQNGYGNVVQLKHGGERSTVYAHLSRIDVKRGEHVDQGQRIGAVGVTGWSTGPHLHFEFRVNGRYQDPLQVAKTSEPITLDPAARTRFTEVAKSLQAQLSIAETLSGRSGLGE